MTAASTRIDFLQESQSLRASRWATTQSIALESRNGSTPMSSRRETAFGASRVCSVDSTKWPVSAASTAMCAVSPSRISPTMMMSGSARMIAFRPPANVIFALALMAICLTPSIRYSTGSSTVTIVRCRC